MLPEASWTGHSPMSRCWRPVILPFGKMPWAVSSPQTWTQMEVLVEAEPPPERTLLAVWELAVLLVE